MTQPIKPDEVEDRKTADIPDQVFEAFNALIVRNFSGVSAVVKQVDAVDQIIKLRNAAHFGCSRQEIFDNGWLNVEESYRKSGWDVEYDKPGYNETYEASFTFRKSCVVEQCATTTAPAALEFQDEPRFLPMSGQQWPSRASAWLGAASDRRIVLHADQWHGEVVAKLFRDWRVTREQVSVGAGANEVEAVEAALDLLGKGSME